MNYLKAKIFTIFLFSFLSTQMVLSQSIAVSNGYTAQQLAEHLAGPNMNVYNASFTGAASQKGQYTYSGSSIETNGGVVLSTGSIFNLQGPNSSGSTSTALSGVGDPELSNLSGTSTNDAVELKFDFEVQSETIEFDFIFGSEEYNEFVGSGFNDVFAFFISGPGINGEENMAVVPTTTDPITINNINNNSYWQFYNDNELGLLTNDIEFDGFTTSLKAFKDNLTPCSTYTLRLVIADGSDYSYDSGVLLEKNSLVQGTVNIVPNTPTVDNTALEGCYQASFTFSLNEPLTYATVIDLDIQGSAINGVDYQTIDNTVTIPAGQTSATLYIDAFEDGFTEGQENIMLLYSPSACAAKDTIELFINDNVPIDYSLSGINLSCFEDSSGAIDASITGGTSPYTINVTNPTGEIVSVPSDNLPLTGLSAGSYQVDVQDVYGCQGEATVVSGEYDAGQTFLPDGNGDVFTSSINISGFGGSVFTTPQQLQSICLNMEHSSLGEVEIKLIAPDGTEIILKERFNQSDGGNTNLGEPVANGPTDGGNNDITPGIGYDYCFTHTPFYGTMVDEKSNYSYTYTDVTGTVLSDNYLPSGSYTTYQSFNDLVGVPMDGQWTIWVKDHNPQDNGYIFNWNISLISPNSGDIVTLTQPDSIDISETLTQPDCGLNNGDIDLMVTGQNSPFTFDWSTGATTEDLTNVGAGNYNVTITDNAGCSQTEYYTFSNSTAPVLTSNIINETCPGSNDGEISISSSETIQSVSWNNGLTTQTISNLSPGNYTVDVLFSDGCIASEMFTIEPASEMTLDFLVTNEECGNMEGEIDLVVQGGVSPYTYAWSTGETTEDITDLTQEWYNVTVTDDYGCSIEDSVYVLNLVGQCTPQCDLEITNSDITHENCGNGQGSVSIVASSTNIPITAHWSNGDTGYDINSLSAGTYSVTLTDVEGCELTNEYQVVNNANGLAITNLTVQNENCSNGLGYIELDVSGGSSPYTYQWDNGATTEDIYNLSAGIYNLTITDNNNCSITRSYEVINEGTADLTFEYVMDEECGDGNGSIDINIQNGSYSYLWSNGETTQDLMNLSAGTYSCEITDINTGCVFTTQNYTVNNNPGDLSVSIFDYDHEICSNSDGEINLSVSGSSTGYTYNWSNGASTQDIFGLNANTYSCVISDNNGCIVETGDIIIQNLSGNLVVEDYITPDTCNQSVGSVILDIVTNAPPYSVSWSNGSSNDTLSNINSSTYSYIVTDTNGCSFNGQSYVGNLSGALSITANITEPECLTSNGSIDITTTGNEGIVSYSWSNGENTEDLSGLSPGAYTLTATDINGCQIIEDFILEGALVLSDSSITHTNCSLPNGAISTTITSGTGINYNWSNGETTTDITNLSQGDYTLNAVSTEGCTYTNTFTVEADSIPCYSLCNADSTSNEQGTLYDSGGAFGNYSNFENCSFLIAPTCVDEITLEFVAFNLANAYDTLLFFDGENSNAPAIDTFTGFSAPGLIVANSGKLFIEFKSNSTGVNSGFQAEWTSTMDSILPVAVFTTSNTNVLYGETVEFISTSTNYNSLSWDFNNDGLENSNEELTSYTYLTPGSFAVSLIAENCMGSDTITETILVQDPPELDTNFVTDSIIEINSCTSVTDSFYIHNNNGGGLAFEITINDNSNSGITVNNSQNTISAGDSALITVNFSNYDYSGQYFDSLQITTNDPVNETIDIIFEVNQNITCLYTMCSDTASYQENGTLFDSGGETGNYSSNENCSFLIDPACADSVFIDFSGVFIYTYDTLFVYDGVDDSAPVLGVYTNVTSIPSLVAASGNAYLKFTSNISYENIGFQANWNTVLYTSEPVANITASNTNPAFNESVTFTSTSTGADSLFWDFDGDGITDAQGDSTTYSFLTSGTNTVTLIASNCLGSDTTSLIIDVQTPPQIDILPHTGDTVYITECGQTVYDSIYIHNLGGGDLIYSTYNGYVSDDFESAIDTNLWAELSGGTVGSTCGSVSGNDGVYFGGSGVRTIETKELNTTNATTFDVYMNFDGCGNSASSFEDVVLEYSTNGGATWTNIFTYQNYMYDGYTFLSTILPNPAKTSATKLRLRQISNSGINNDTWSIDDVIIQEAFIPGLTSIVASNDSMLIVNEFNTYDQSGTYYDTIQVTSNDTTNSHIDVIYTIIQSIDCEFEMCSDTMSDEQSGTLFDSGGETGNYSSYENCSFLIDPNCADSVLIDFSGVSIYTYDTLFVYDGVDDSAPVLGVYTNVTSIPSLVAASGNTYLEFTSNGGSENIGFQADWNTVLHTGPPVTSLTASNTNPAFNETVTFMSTSIGADSLFWDFNGDGNTDAQGDSAYYSFQTSGSNTVTLITSNCFGSDTATLTINVQTPPQIDITPHTGDTIYITECGQTVYDSIYIHNLGTGDLIFDNSNDNLSDDFESSIDSSLWAQFTGGTIGATCGSVSGNDAVYFGGLGLRTIETVELNTTNANSFDFYMNFDGCGNSASSFEDVVLEYSTDGGATWINIFTYQNYMYDGFTSVSTLLPNPAKTSATKLRLRQLSNSGTNNDTWSIDDVLIQGATIPGMTNLVAANDSMLVISEFNSYGQSGTYYDTMYVTSNDTTNPQIDVIYTIIQDVDCKFNICTDTESTEKYGTLFDSGGETGNYSSYENCSFLIDPACADSVFIDFSGVSIYTYDTLFVYDGVDDSAPVLGVYTNVTSIPSLVASSGNAYLKFTSNVSYENIGFKANWSTVLHTGPPVANFTASNTNPAFNETVTFTSTSIGADSLFWDFDGDGITDAQGDSTNYSFQTSGANTVTLITSNCLGSDTTSLIIDVQTPPIIDITPHNSDTLYITECGQIVYDSIYVHNTGGGDLIYSVNNGYLGDDFESGLNSSLWEQLTAGTVGATCGSVSGNDGVYFGGFGSRLIETVELNTTNANSFDLHMNFEGCGNSASSYEDVVLEYSIDGGTTWTNIFTYQNYMYNGFTSVSTVLPNPAKTSATKLRLRQLSNSGTNNDTWSIDDVRIQGAYLTNASNLVASNDSVLVVNQYYSYDQSGTYYDTVQVTSNDTTNLQIDVIYTIIQDIDCKFTICNDTGSDEISGVLFDSGGETGNYSSNENCSFLIAPDCADSIFLDFSNVSITYNDSIIIYDGTDATAPILGLYNGANNISPLVAPSGNAFIQFISNASGENTGFQVDWSTVLHTGPPVASFTASNTNPAFNESVTFTSTSTGASNLAWDFDGDGTIDDQGEIVDYSFQTSGANTVTLIANNCLGSDTSYLIIDVQTTPQIDITPHTGDTIYITACGQTVYDSIYIHNLGDGDLLYTASNNNISDDFESGLDNSLWEEFTGGTVGATCGSVSGNDGVYFGGSGPRVIETVELNTTDASSFDFYLNFDGCGDNAEGAEDVVLEYSTDGGTTWTNIYTYENYMYSGYTSLSTSLPTAAKTTATKLRLRQLSNSGLNFDNWSIDDVVINGPFISSTTNSIASNDSVLVVSEFNSYDQSGTYYDTIQITSNDTTNSQIDIIYTIIQDFDCEYIMCTDSESNEQAGTLFDSGGEAGNYSSFENCSFLITPDCADSIFIEFNNTNIYNNDTLFIYDGVDATAPALGVYSSINSIPSLIATSGNMYIEFKSNGFYETIGFEANWSSVLNDEPLADFTYSPSTINTGETVSFTNLTMNGTTYGWDFDGDGIIDSNDENPNFVYSNGGVYNVTLVAYGCINDTMVQTIQVGSIGLNTFQDVDLTIYPNPSSEGVYYIEGSILPKEIEIYDNLGKQIQFDYKAINNEKAVIYILSKEPGVYYLKTNTTTFKLIK